MVLVCVREREHMHQAASDSIARIPDARDKKNTSNQIKEQQVINANVFGVKAFETI